MSTPEDEKKKKEETAYYAKRSQTGADGNSASKANLGMGMMPPEAFGDFLQIQPMSLEGSVPKFMLQDQQKQFQNIISALGIDKTLVVTKIDANKLKQL